MAANEAKELLNNILSSSSLIVGEDDSISLKFGDTLKHWEIDGKKAYLPTSDEKVRKDKDIIFVNPFVSSPTENNPVIDSIRQHFGKIIHVKILKLLTELIIIACNTASHKNFKANQYRLLEVIKNIDANTYDRWLKTLSKKTFISDVCFSSLFLKRNGIINGATYARVCVVQFPFYDSLETNTERRIVGTQYKKEEIKSLKLLFEHIFENISDKSKWSFGANGVTCTHFRAIVSAYSAACLHINEIVDTIREHLKMPDDIYTDLSAVEKILDYENDDALRQAAQELPTLNTVAPTAKVEQKQIFQQNNIPRKAAPVVETKPFQKFSERPVAQKQPIIETRTENPTNNNNDDSSNQRKEYTLSDFMRKKNSGINEYRGADRQGGPNTFTTEDGKSWLKKPNGDIVEIVNSGFNRNEQRQYRIDSNTPIKKLDDGNHYFILDRNIVALAKWENDRWVQASDIIDITRQDRNRNSWGMGSAISDRGEMQTSRSRGWGSYRDSRENRWSSGRDDSSGWGDWGGSNNRNRGGWGY